MREENGKTNLFSLYTDENLKEVTDTFDYKGIYMFSSSSIEDKDHKIGTQIKISNWVVTKITDKLWISNCWNLEEINHILDILEIKKLDKIIKIKKESTIIKKEEMIGESNE